MKDLYAAWNRTACTIMMKHLTFALFASFVLTTGCGASLTTRNGRRGESQLPWIQAVYPASDLQEVRVDRYEGAVVLLRGGQIVGSTSDEDLHGQVMGMLAALAFAPDGPAVRRVGQIGFGTGTSVAVALGAGARSVDVFENDGHLVAAAEVIATKQGISYQTDERRPIHPALRLVPAEQAEEERFLRYDVLVSPPATSILAGPRELFTVERFENLFDLVGSGGIMVQHVPAYDMLPETFHRLLRTFADIFQYMTVLAANTHSGDLFLIGSSSPLRFRVERLRALAASPGLQNLLNEVKVTHPFDIAAHIVFASRREVLAFTGNAAPCSAGAPLAADALPRRPPVPRPDASEAERQAWSQELEGFRRRFARMDLLREEMFSLDWPYGRVCPDGPSSMWCLFADITANASGAEALAELSLSLMAAGRFVEAQQTLETAARFGEGELLSRAEVVLTLLLDAPPDLSSRMPEALGSVRNALVDGRCQDALSAISTIEPSSAGEPNHDELFVAAYTLVRCQAETPEAMERVAALVGNLVEDRSFFQRYPEVLYFEAHASMVLGNYDRATWTMVDYVSLAEPPRETNQPDPEPQQEPEPEDS